MLLKRIVPFQETNVRCNHCSSWHILSISWQYILAVLVLSRIQEVIVVDNSIYRPMNSNFRAESVSVLLYGSTTWTLTKRLEKRLDGNYTRMLHTVWKKSWEQHYTKQQLYGHLLPISQITLERRARHAGEKRTNSWVTFSYGPRCWLISKNLHSSALSGH